MKAIQVAEEAAVELGEDQVQATHLLLALITSADPDIDELLGTWGVDAGAVRARIDELAAEEESEPGGSEAPT